MVVDFGKKTTRFVTDIGLFMTQVTFICEIFTKYEILYTTIWFCYQRLCFDTSCLSPGLLYWKLGEVIEFHIIQAFFMR